MNKFIVLSLLILTLLISGCQRNVVVPSNRIDESLLQPCPNLMLLPPQMNMGQMAEELFESSVMYLECQIGKQSLIDSVRALQGDK
jgi:hypothetical protein